MDNSQISVYQKCPYAYYLQYKEGIKRREQPHLEQGSNVHNLLMNLYLGKIGDINDKKYQFVLDAYREHYKDNFKILAVEETIQLDFDFVVKPDLVVEQSGNIFGYEHKTTDRNLDDKYFSRYKTSAQVEAQFYAIKHKFGRCDGIIINAISIKDLKRKPTSDSYVAWKEIDGRYIALELQREPISKTDKQIEQWKTNTLRWIDSIQKEDLYRKCTSSYACNLCDMLDLCKFSFDDKVDESVLQMYYERCDPYAYLNP